MKHRDLIAAKRVYQTWTILLVLAALSGGCASRKLPDKAASALHESIREWAVGEATFEIVSAQKAGADASEITLPTGVTAETGKLGACPPAGTSETWCVVIVPAISDREGNAASRFLVQSQGRYWDAQKLLETDRAVFEMQGCTNWDAP